MKYFEINFLKNRIFKTVRSKNSINKIINFSIPKIFKIPVITAENPILLNTNLWVKISINIRINPSMIQINQDDII